jgi:hypothetical protein
MFPASIRFTYGRYKDLVFHRGTGPTTRQTIEGVRVLMNSTNFWYNGSIRLSAEFLKDKQLIIGDRVVDRWVEA